jgi:hypothetical protein
MAGSIASMRVLAVVAAAAALLCLGSSASAVGTGASIYGGVGTWVDIFAYTARAHPQAVVASLRAHDVKTLYLETSNYSHDEAIVHPAVVGAFLDAAHAAGINVVAWYLPAFMSPSRDLARSLAAIRFRSRTGQRFDSFALDIESSAVHSVPLRNRRLLDLARAIRHAAGLAYPLGAIIPSPVGMLRHPTYWPGFPYADLGTVFDAFVPMAYFSYYTNTQAGAYAYIRGVVSLIRVETGRADVPIQLIGGIADHMGRGALEGFARAATDCGVAGVSLYAYLETSTPQWLRLAGTRLGSVPIPACAGS